MELKCLMVISSGGSRGGGGGLGVGTHTCTFVRKVWYKEVKIMHFKVRKPELMVDPPPL